MRLPTTQSQRLGKAGEDLAARFLVKRGYRIIGRNFKKRYGELDIICLVAGTLVFVEVKTRIGRRFGRPEEAVTPRKLREVILTAQYYASLHPELPRAQRIDVIAIELNADYSVRHFNHIQNVTG